MIDDGEYTQEYPGFFVHAREMAVEGPIEEWINGYEAFVYLDTQIIFTIERSVAGFDSLTDFGNWAFRQFSLRLAKVLEEHE